MNKFALGGIATALALALSPAANAADFIIDDPANPASGSFTTKSATPGFTSVTAQLDNTVSGAFDDTFSFILPVDGIGSGSITTSFTSAFNKLTISKVIITTLAGVTELTNPTKIGNTFALGSDAVQIIGSPTAFNSIRVLGTVAGTGTYSGTVSFSAFTAAVPEASTWALMIFGVGAIGFAARRSRKTAVRVTYA
jgi:hypothetical protein